MTEEEVAAGESPAPPSSSPAAARGARPRGLRGPGQRLGQGLFGAGLLAFVAVIGARPLGDPDLGWHLAQGRVIVQTGSIPAVDPFAYTHRAVQRVDLIGDVLLYVISRLGPAALQIGGAVVALAIALALLALTRRVAPFSRLIVALSLTGLSSWLAVRPVMLSFLCFPVLLLLLEAHREAPASRSGRRALALALPLLAIIFVIFFIHFY